MTLDPGHFEGIRRLARRIDHDVDETDHQDAAETVWEEFLDPLYDDGTAVLEPLSDRRKRCVNVEDAALQAEPFETQHGLDSGTLNPQLFTNGLLLDVAQAAMSATPSDLDLHRSRTIVATAHSNDGTLALDDGWDTYDDGYVRMCVLQAPRVDRYEERVVHDLALYLAESEHLLAHVEDVSDLALLDGPIYPKGILNWPNRHPGLADTVATDETTQRAVQNYVDLVDAFVDREVPLVGFVKNVSSKGVTRAVREKTLAPWANDAALFTQVLERREGRGVDERTRGRDRRVTDELTFTNWFVSRVGSDDVVPGEDRTFDLDRSLDPAAYQVTYFLVYEPREDLLFKVEAPYAFTRDEATREGIERQVLRDVAANRGPPAAVSRADQLAHVNRRERRSLIDLLERTFDSRKDRNYNNLRWDVS
jgi:hypothetical protein